MVSQYQEKSDSLRAYVIDPTKPRMRYWDAIITSMLLFTAIITPFEIAFLTPEFNFLFYINRLIDLTFLIDVFINFHLAYFCQTESKWVFDLQRIRRRYIHGWLIIDFISIVPFDIANIMLGGGDDSGAQVDMFFTHVYTCTHMYVYACIRE